MAVTGLANLAVKVSDLEAACAWYEAAGGNGDRAGRLGERPPGRRAVGGARR